MERRALQDSEIVGRAPFLSNHCPAIVAIPARNEAERIERCLSALAMQRDSLGAPVPKGAFGVLVLVNNSTDETAQIVRRLSAALPFAVEVLQLRFTGDATAGGARRRAMEEAADRLRKGADEGILLTTDADSMVAPTWFANTLSHLAAGIDCVAGYIDAEPAEIVSHGPLFLARGRLEDSYLRLIAEIEALCDPRPHNPWPTHRVSSGASLAVTLAAYKAVGGMPGKALGEDAAFTALLDDHGFKVRHALDVTVMTSCRPDGRAAGGAADTMRHRRDTPDAPCDLELEPAFAALRRAAYRGYLRKSFHSGNAGKAFCRLLANSSPSEDGLNSFRTLWNEMETRHPKLQRGSALSPSDLPGQIAAAKFILRHLRAGSARAQDDKYRRAKVHAPAAI